MRSLVARQDPELLPERRREKAKVLALASEMHELEGSMRASQRGCAAGSSVQLGESPGMAPRRL
ncbi:hypothetical protein [Nannocystis pusilla]|uniref:hypothetical protein n=1 Tax=Nannocystis pusilla TaxID=889268 RepID=UPI003DA3B841